MTNNELEKACYRLTYLAKRITMFISIFNYNRVYLPNEKEGIISLGTLNSISLDTSNKTPLIRFEYNKMFCSGELRRHFFIPYVYEIVESSDNSGAACTSESFRLIASINYVSTKNEKESLQRKYDEGRQFDFLDYDKDVLLREMREAIKSQARS